jgi:uncharacterized integral membrane protein
MIEPEDEDQLTEPVAEPVPTTLPVPVTPAEPTKSAAQKAQDTVANVYHLLRMIVLIVLGFIVALFVVRNWNSEPFDYVFGEKEMPLAVVMLIFLGIGIVLGMLLGWLLRRKGDRR